MLLELRDVSFTYMDNTSLAKEVLCDINFSVGDGEFVSLIGPTGSGKSTLIQHFNGLLRPTSGQVIFDGKKIGEDISPRLVRQEIGLVFQSPENQLFGETVFDDVAFGIRNFGYPLSEVESRVREALGAVGLDYSSFKNRSPFSLSGGEMRKVAIAGVIAMRPRMLVLDEPTTGLDAQGKHEIMLHLRKLHLRGETSIFLISHDMDEVAAVSDQVLVLSEGRITLVGSPKQVFKEAETLYKIGLGVPQAISLLTALQKRGISLQAETLTFGEMEEALLAHFTAYSRK